MSYDTLRRCIELQIKIGRSVSKLKCGGFRATSLSIYDFSTLYTTLPHNQIKEKLLDSIVDLLNTATKQLNA